jgi:hypothetical protein
VVQLKVPVIVDEAVKDLKKKGITGKQYAQFYAKRKRDKLAV